MKLRHSLAASAALLPVAMLSTPAFAQSTGSVDFQNEIIVTGSANKGVAGFQSPDTSKAKSVLGQEVIERANPGQTILDTINLVPGVTFTNNDAYGSAGGQLSIRGFSSDRISLTMDGVPLNDSGGYSIYSNQQMDPELIEQVNVNLGSTDVDSPTAAATGSTVNYRTRLPNEEFGVHVSGSAGEFNFMRIFGAVDTGVFTGIGTRAFVSASTTSNDNPFNNYGRIKKSQFNARLYQPIGADGDFVSIAGHYNENRNNFFGSVPLRTDLKRLVGGVEVDRNVGSGSNDRFPLHNGEREYDINWPCNTNATAVAGAADAASSCGTEFDRRFNPSNTGNIRGSSRFTLNDSLVLTVDPSYQYVKANGGGTVNAREALFVPKDKDGNPILNANGLPVYGDGITGYIGGRPYFGTDLNGDGDLLDEVAMLAPSQTRTDRYGVIANLRWNINDNHTLRLGYTWDSARHRQTGEVGLLQANGTPFDVFPMDNPQTDASGHVLQKRDRLSYAILHQISGEYRGEFLDGALVANVGIRAPFMKRNLNNYCFTTSVSGFVDCFAQDAERNDAYTAANPNVQGPQKRVKKYDDILPNLGLVYKIDQNTSVFANYSKGLQVPGTDNLYNAFYYADNTAGANPRPEMTDNFDLGARYRSGKIQAQASVWYTRYQDRLASAYDPELDRNVYRNLGRVDKYGIDGSISYQPIPELALYAFGSYMKSEIKDNVLIDVDSNGNNVYELTAGKREGGAPAYTFGGSARALLGHVDLGVTAKRTGGRYLYDNNMPFVDGAGNVAYGAKTNAYWLVNLDARVNLEFLGLNDKTFFQLNVYNLFDALYVGNYNSSLAPTADKALNAQIGAPRTISGTISVQF